MAAAVPTPKRNPQTPSSQAPRRIDIPGSFDSVDMSTMGGRMAWARNNKELTQVEVAKLVEKSRATIVQYEQNKIAPPVEAIERVARVLGVEPEFLAFGKQGIKGLTNASEEVVVVPEITFGKNGEFPSGAMAFTKKMMDRFGVDRLSCKVFVMAQSSPAFDLNAGDLLITDTKTVTLVPNHNLYLLRTPSGPEVVRRETNLTGGKNAATFTTSNGSSLNADPKKLTFIGAIVGTVRQN